MGSLDGMGSPITYLQKPASNPELYQNAAVEYAKVTLAMVPTGSESYTLAQLAPDYKKGDISGSDRPMSQKFRSDRMASDVEWTITDTWQDSFSELVKQLPPGLKEWFLEQAALPYSERSQLYLVMSAFLTLAATADAFIDRASAPISPDSAILERADYNLVIPYIALQGIYESGREILSSASLLLESVGPGHKDFDLILDYTNQLQQIQNQVGALLTTLGQDPVPDSVKEDIAALISQINALKAQYQNTPVSTFQALGTHINSLSTTLDAVSLGIGSASLLWQTSLVTNGLFETQSPSGVIGGGFQEVSENWVSGMLQLYMPNATPAETQLLTAGASLINLAILGTGLLIIENGIVQIPAASESVQNRLNTYSADLLLNFVLQSGIIEQMYRGLAQAIGADEETQQKIAEALTYGTLLMLVSAADSEALFQGISPLLASYNARIESAVNAAIASGDLTEATDAHLYLQQMNIALEKGDYQGFKEASAGILHLLTVSPDQLISEGEKIKQLAQTVKEAWTLNRSDRANAQTAAVTSA